MGARRTRSASSRASGGGIWPSTQTDANSKGKNTAPAAAGIHIRSTCPDCISQAPTDFTTPDDRMKLAQSMAPSTSDTRRPSM